MSQFAYLSCGTDHSSAITISSNLLQQRSSSTINIPVVVHFNGGFTNDNIACLIDGSLDHINQLNIDFSATNSDHSDFLGLSAVCPDDFIASHLAGDSDIRFYLATLNHPVEANLQEGEYAVTIGDYIFNTEHVWKNYLNIYVSDNVGIDLEVIGGQAAEIGIGGVTNENGNSFVSSRGYWMNPKAFFPNFTSCTSGITIGYNGDGRTGTHEAGHWLGLKHTFGDNNPFSNNSSPNCDLDDGISDTPDQSIANNGLSQIGFQNIPNLPCYTFAANSCNSQDYFLNYMDYSIVRSMFTVEQVNVMHNTANHGLWKQSAIDFTIRPKAYQYTLEKSCNFNLVDNIVSNDEITDQLIFSEDNDPSDGLTEEFSQYFFKEGQYTLYAYYYNSILDTYSAPSFPITVNIIDCCDPSDNNLVLEEALSLQGEINFKSDVIIESNNTLIIEQNSSILFAEEKSLIIKSGAGLIIEGPNVTLDKCPNATSWQGIIIENGGSLVINGATILNAEKSITANRYQQLDINSLSIQGQDTPLSYGITFTGIGNNPNTGTISNTHISDFECGIHIMGDPGNLTIDRSSFYTNDIGIKVSLAHPASGKLTLSNSTFRNNVDVQTTGMFFEDIEIQKNVFWGKEYGILGDGASQVTAVNNNFYRSYLNTFEYQTGQNQNDFIENNFYGIIGIHPQGDNVGMSYLDNCFSTQSQDVNSVGTIAAALGNDQIGAGNCFSHHGQDIIHEGVSFDYFYIEENCFEPLVDSNFDKEISLKINDEVQCGSGHELPTDISFSCLSWGMNCNDILGAISAVNASIEEIKKNDDKYSSSVQQVLLSRFKNCLRLLIIKKAQECGFDEGPQAANDNLIKIGIVGILLEDGQFTAALNILNQLEGISEELDDYVYIQRQNINRLNNREQNIWSARDLEMIKAIGQKEYPLAAYARGLLTILTGEILYPDVILARRQIDFRSDNTQHTETSVLSITPNPVSDILTLSYSDSEIEIVSYNIINIHGKSIFMGSDKTINLSETVSGVYMIQVLLSNGKIVNKKISKI